MQTNRHTVPRHEGKLFTWEGNQGTINERAFQGTLIDAQVWNDADDLGFEVRSHKTGTFVLFILDSNRCTSGCRVYSPLKPGFENLTIKVFND